MSDISALTNKICFFIITLRIILYIIIKYLCMLVTNYYGVFKCKCNICFRLQIFLEIFFSFICDFNVHWFVRFFFFHLHSLCYKYAYDFTTLY